MNIMMSTTVKYYNITPWRDWGSENSWLSKVISLTTIEEHPQNYDKK